MALPTLSTYGGTTLAPGYAGGIAEAGPDDIVTRMNESATALDFGQICVAGVAVGAGTVQNCKPQTADGDVIEGVTMREAGGLTASTDGNNTVNYARYQAVPVMKKGCIWVAPCEDVVAKTAALVVTAGTGSKIASTTGGAAGAGRVAFAGVWETTTLSGVLGKLRVNIT